MIAILILISAIMIGAAFVGCIKPGELDGICKHGHNDPGKDDEK